jgi:hypothetical protein
MDNDAEEGEEFDEETMLALVPSSNSTVGEDDATFARDDAATESNRWLPLGIFFVKIVSLMIPCSPYLCSVRVLYPLLTLAGLDIIMYTPKHH